MDELFLDDELENRLPAVYSPEYYCSVTEEETIKETRPIELTKVRRPVWMIILTISLVAVGILAVLTFLQAKSLVEHLDALTTRVISEVASLNDHLDTIASQIPELEKRVSTLETSEVGWQINGRIQNLGTGNPYAGGFLIVEARSPDTNDWQNVGTRPSGEFSVPFTHPDEPLQVRVTIASLPDGWQAQLDANAGSWTAAGENTFEAMFNSLAEAQQPLVVNIGVSRSFSGMVQIGQLPGNLPPETAVTLSEQGPEGNWRQVDTQTVQSDGRFDFTYPSAIEDPVYRLEASFGAAYETILSEGGVGQVDGNGVLITQPQPNNEVNLVYELAAVTLTADKWQPIDQNWRVNTSPDGYTYYTAITESAQPLQGDIYLPYGAYQMSVWTPVEEAVDAVVRYTVEIDHGVSEGAEICQPFESEQSARKRNNEDWWDFTTAASDSRSLRLQSNGGTATVRILPPGSAENDTLMGIGPVQFSVIQIESERPIEPCQ